MKKTTLGLLAFSIITLFFVLILSEYALSKDYQAKQLQKVTPRKQLLKKDDITLIKQKMGQLGFQVGKITKSIDGSYLISVSNYQPKIKGLTKRGRFRPFEIRAKVVKDKLYLEIADLVKEKFTIDTSRLTSGVVIGNIQKIETAVPFRPVITFRDPNLEQAIREKIGKPRPQPIYLDDVSHITSFQAREIGVRDLDGIQNLKSLTELSLGRNQISDLSPLSNLTNLEKLWAEKNQISDLGPLSNLRNLTILRLPINRISDVGPIAGLTKLRELALWSNQINDISSLSNLTELIGIELGDNQISDISSLSHITKLIVVSMMQNEIQNISALSGMNELQVIYLYENQINDINPLSNLRNLKLVYLQQNQISDVRPLIQNPGIGRGDIVDLQANPINCNNQSAYIHSLRSSGATIFIDCR